MVLVRDCQGLWWGSKCGTTDEIRPSFIPYTGRYRVRHTRSQVQQAGRFNGRRQQVQLRYRHCWKQAGKQVNTGWWRRVCCLWLMIVGGNGKIWEHLQKGEEKQKHIYTAISKTCTFGRSGHSGRFKLGSSQWCNVSDHKWLCCYRREHPISWHKFLLP